MPSEEEINTYLTALNRTQKMWVHGKVSERNQERSIGNLRKWFKNHHIKVRQKKDGEWEIVEKREEEEEKKFDGESIRKPRKTIQNDQY